MEYRCEATTVGGFVQQLAVQYVSHGYWFYVTSVVPEPKDPREVDRKLIDRYRVAVSRSERSRRKKAGLGNVQYLRHGRIIALLATHGEHRFFAEEPFRDIRHHALSFEGYSVSYRGGHVSVRIGQADYKRWKTYLVDLAVRRTAQALGAEFRRIPFEPYAPVRTQLIGILRAVNRKRKLAAYEEVPLSALRLKRRIYRPFEPIGEGAAARFGIAEATKVGRASSVAGAWEDACVSSDSGDGAGVRPVGGPHVAHEKGLGCRSNSSG